MIDDLIIDCAISSLAHRINIGTCPLIDASMDRH